MACSWCEPRHSRFGRRRRRQGDKSSRNKTINHPFDVRGRNAAYKKSALVLIKSLRCFCLRFVSVWKKPSLNFDKIIQVVGNRSYERLRLIFTPDLSSTQKETPKIKRKSLTTQRYSIGPFPERRKANTQCHATYTARLNPFRPAKQAPGWSLQVDGLTRYWDDDSSTPPSKAACIWSSSHTWEHDSSCQLWD